MAITSIMHKLVYGVPFSERMGCINENDTSAKVCALGSAGFGCVVLDIGLPCALVLIGLLGILGIAPAVSSFTGAFYGAFLGAGILLLLVESGFVASELRVRIADNSDNEETIDY